MNRLASITSATFPALVAAAGECAGVPFLEFYAANIRNPNTRRACARAADEFLAWCAATGVQSIAAMQPVHVATWIKAGTRSAHPLNASPVGLYFTRAGSSNFRRTTRLTLISPSCWRACARS